MNWTPESLFNGPRSEAGGINVILNGTQQRSTVSLDFAWGFPYSEIKNPDAREMTLPSVSRTPCSILYETGRAFCQIKFPHPSVSDGPFDSLHDRRTDVQTAGIHGAIFEIARNRLTILVKILLPGRHNACVTTFFVTQNGNEHVLHVIKTILIIFECNMLILNKHDCRYIFNCYISLIIRNFNLLYIYLTMIIYRIHYNSTKRIY